VNATGEAFTRLYMFREAIASVSLSHEQSCNCDICKAAQGDEEAFARVVDQQHKRDEAKGSP
jgi:hypothetical protein